MLEKLTIAIPTYNRIDYLCKLLQTIPNNFAGEVVVSDNGGFVTSEVKHKYPDFKFVVPVQELKMFANWNYALDHVQTEFFVMPSDDDLFDVNAFSTIETALKQSPQSDIFVFGHHVIDEHDQILSSWSPVEGTYQFGKGFLNFNKGVDARCPSVIFRTSVARDLGKFIESYEFTAADSLLIQKCLLNGNSRFVPKIISSYRTWPNNFTSQLIGTKAWLDKVECWTSEIEELVGLDPKKRELIPDMKNFKDEIYARNLIGGILNKREQKGRVSALRFFITKRFPFRADFRTQLRLFKVLVIG